MTKRTDRQRNQPKNFDIRDFKLQIRKNKEWHDMDERNDDDVSETSEL